MGNAQIEVTLYSVGLPLVGRVELAPHHIEACKIILFRGNDSQCDYKWTLKHRVWHKPSQRRQNMGSLNFPILASPFGSALLRFTNPLFKFQFRRI